MSDVTLAIIPARMGSTRFPGKVVFPICGKPMIQHVWEQVSQCSLLDAVVVASDDSVVNDIVEGFGGTAVLTSSSHMSGTSRIVECLPAFPDAEFIINVQADEPLLPPAYIDKLVAAIKNRQEAIHIITLATGLFDAEQIEDANVVKVVFNASRHALYFSRAAIPYRKSSSLEEARYYKHLGIYAYTRTFLEQYNTLPESPLEHIEGLEQLRFLNAGFDIQVECVDSDTIGVDVLADIKKVEDILSKGGRDV